MTPHRPPELRFTDNPLSERGREHAADLINACRSFVEYYDKNGSHRLGNGKAFQFYIEAKRILQDLSPDQHKNEGPL